MQIFIRNISSKTIVLDVHTTDSIHVVQKKIFERTSIPPHRISLAFQGKMLHASRPLHDCKLQKDDTLHVIFRRNVKNINDVINLNF